MTIAVDFDGTCVTNDYPRIGKNIGAAPVLRKLVEKGNRIILLTMRTDDSLEEAKGWFWKNNIPLWGVNSNPEQKEWSDSPKIYADLYIDDSALTLLADYLDGYSEKPFIKWDKALIYLEMFRLLTFDEVKELWDEVKKDFEQS